MDSNLRTEDIISRVKDKLNKDKIKLWLEPYYDKNIGIGPDEEQAFQLLCVELSQQLNMSPEHCFKALKELQDNALGRIKSNQVFQETGVASVKVKISGEKSKTVTIDIALTSNTYDLMDKVGNQVSLQGQRIKLISQGTVLRPAESLLSQGVKNGSQLMAVIMADEQFQDAEKRFKTLENTKKDVQLLAGRSNANDEFYMQIENQSGEALDLPYHERKALVTAMTLHEKGRAALKREDYSLALVLFLEADKEYNGCNSQLLSTVDNYALLHLDISWCYLCLRNAVQIPDAERRLSLCEKSFHKSYGEHLERLMALKGTTGNEAALFMRLHLLQGVVCFHQNRRVEARKLFERAQSELAGLKVDDNNLCLLMELGFTSEEARLGLRAAHNNVEAAEEMIQRKRKEKELAREKNRALREQEKERNQLGLCADGRQFCEPSLVQQLVNMGFHRKMSIAALKLANNSVSEALTIIQEQPHLLPPECSHSISEESLAQVVSMGVPQHLAQQALEKFPELEKAVKSLTSLNSPSGSGVNALEHLITSALSFIQDMMQTERAKAEQQAEEFKAFKRVSEDLLNSDLSEDHLDMNLMLEEQFLMEYMSLLD